MPSARVLVACVIDGKPVEPGDVVEVCANTFANLVRKGRLADATEEASETPHGDPKRKAPKLSTR